MNAKDEKHIKKIIEYCEATQVILSILVMILMNIWPMTITKEHVLLTLSKLESILVDCPMSSKTSIQILLGIV